MDKKQYTDIKELLDSDNSIELQNYLTQNNISVNENFSFNTKKDRFITYAVNNNKLEVVKILLKNPEIEINMVNESGISPLVHCIIFDKEEIFNELIKHKSPGLNISSVNKDGVSRLYPMTRAAQRKNILMVKKINEHPENDWSLQGNLPFFYALENKNTELCLYLMTDKKFNPKENLTSSTPFNEITERLNKKLLVALANLNYNPNEYNEKGAPIWWKKYIFLNKSSTNYHEKFNKLVSSYPLINFNTPNKKGKTILEELIHPDNYIGFNVLVENPKLDIYSTNKEGKTILEQLLSYSCRTDFDNKKITERVNLVTQRILKEDIKIEETLVKVETCPDTPLKHWVAAHLRNNIMEKTITDNSVRTKKLKI